jgi:hypothetical protein
MIGGAKSLKAAAQRRGTRLSGYIRSLAETEAQQRFYCLQESDLQYSFYLLRKARA